VNPALHRSGSADATGSFASFLDRHRLPARPRASLLRGLLFLVVFGALQNGFELLRGGRFERFVIDTATVQPARSVIVLLSPADQVRAAGPRLIGRRGGINILAGCEGTEVAFLLAAAIAVAPLSWRRRLAALAGGLALVFLLNELRIVALFFAASANRAWFDPLHSLVAPVAMVTGVVAYVYVWIRRSPSLRLARAG